MRKLICLSVVSGVVSLACSGTDSDPGGPSFGGNGLGSGGRGGATSGGTAALAQGGSSGGSLAGGANSQSGGASLTSGGAAGGNASAGASIAGGATSSGGSSGANSQGGAGTSQGGTSLGGSAGKDGAGGVAGKDGSGGSTGGASPLPCANNQVAKCTGTSEIACHFGGDPGNYEVTLELGGSSAGDMYVEAESYRRMLGHITTAAGETKRYSFVVNVRQPEGQPVQNGANDGTPGLDVYIRGAHPKLTSICSAPANPRPKMIWIAGDSTVCDQSGTDYAGWGQHLPQFFAAPVSIANYADSGESSGSFLNGAKFWTAIKAQWSAGDWVFVQLGHNDKDTTAATFKANMTAFVTQAKAAHVNIVLVTPISRVGYSLASEHVNSTGANLPQIIRDLAKSQDVPLIDLTVTTWNWLQTITWQDYFALGTDKTHTNPKGAEVVAGFVRDATKTQNIAFAEFLR